MQSISTRTDPRIALFLFAHQDDEYAAVPWLLNELSAGAIVRCIYLTDGASRTPAAIRDAESSLVLTSLGVEEKDVVFLQERCRDGALARHIDRTYRALEQWLAEESEEPDIVYVPDWEGGHPDHDATHLIGLRIAAAHDACDIWSFSLYNAYRCVRPFFSSLRLLPGGERRTLRHRPSDGWRWAMLCWRYPSQRRTWLGLFPGAFFQRVVARRESLRRCDVSRVYVRPHEGQLLYERMFATPYEAFAQITGPFINRLRAGEQEERANRFV